MLNGQYNKMFNKEYLIFNIMNNKGYLIFKFISLRKMFDNKLEEILYGFFSFFCCHSRKNICTETCKKDSILFSISLLLLEKIFFSPMRCPREVYIGSVLGEGKHLSPCPLLPSHFLSFLPPSFFSILAKSWPSRSCEYRTSA